MIDSRCAFGKTKFTGTPSFSTGDIVFELTSPSYSLVPVLPGRDVADSVGLLARKVAWRVVEGFRIIGTSGEPFSMDKS